MSTTSRPGGAGPAAGASAVAARGSRPASAAASAVVPPAAGGVIAGTSAAASSSAAAVVSPLAEKIQLLESAVADCALKNQITNARKMDLLVDLDAYFRAKTIPSGDEQLLTLTSLINRCLEQNPTASIKKLCASVLNNLYENNSVGGGGGSSSSSSGGKKVVEMHEEVELLLKDALGTGSSSVGNVGDKDEGGGGEKKQSKLRKFMSSARMSRTASHANQQAQTAAAGAAGNPNNKPPLTQSDPLNYRTAALFVVGELLVQQNQFLSQFTATILETISKHYGSSKLEQTLIPGDVHLMRLNSLQTLLKLVYSSVQLTPQVLYEQVYRSIIAKVLVTDKSYENKNIALTILKLLIAKNPVFAVLHSEEIVRVLLRVFSTFDLSSFRCGGNGIVHGVSGNSASAGNYLLGLAGHVAAAGRSASRGSGGTNGATTAPLDGLYVDLVDPALAPYFAPADASTRASSTAAGADATAGTNNANAAGAQQQSTPLALELLPSLPQPQIVAVNPSLHAEALNNVPLLLAHAADVLALVLLSCCNQEAAQQNADSIAKLRADYEKKTKENWLQSAFSKGDEQLKAFLEKKPVTSDFSGALQYLLNLEKTLELSTGTTGAAAAVHVKPFVATVIVRFCVFFQRQCALSTYSSAALVAGSGGAGTVRPFVNTTTNPNNPSGEFEVYSRGISALLALLANEEIAHHQNFFLAEKVALSVAALIQSATEKNAQSQLVGRFLIGAKLNKGLSSAGGKSLLLPPLQLHAVLLVLEQALSDLGEEAVFALNDAECGPSSGNGGSFVELLLCVSSLAGSNPSSNSMSNSAPPSGSPVSKPTSAPVPSRPTTSVGQQDEQIATSTPHPFLQTQVAAVLRTYLTKNCPPLASGSASMSSFSSAHAVLNLLLNHVSVHSAELLGMTDFGGAPPANRIAVPVQRKLSELLGYGVALATVVATTSSSSRFFRSAGGGAGALDGEQMAGAIFSCGKALLQPHPAAASNLPYAVAVDHQRRSLAFFLFESLMSLGADWIKGRVPALFSFWKTELGKKAVDDLKAIYANQFCRESLLKNRPTSAAATAAATAGDHAATARLLDNLVPFFAALRALHAFLQHGRSFVDAAGQEHLPKIVVAFLTNASQLVTALPHPCSREFANLQLQELQARTPSTSTSATSATFFGGRYQSLNCFCFSAATTATTIAETLLGIRGLIYKCFALLKKQQYSSRSSALLHMAADDVSRRDNVFGAMSVNHLLPGASEQHSGDDLQDFVGAQSYLAHCLSQKFFHRSDSTVSFPAEKSSRASGSGAETTSSSSGPFLLSSCEGELADAGPLEMHNFFASSPDDQREAVTFGHVAGVHALAMESYACVGRTSTASPLTAREVLLSSNSARGVMANFSLATLSARPGLLLVAAMEKLVCSWRVPWSTTDVFVASEINHATLLSASVALSTSNASNPSTHRPSPEWDWMSSALQMLVSVGVSNQTEENARVATLKHFLVRAQQSASAPLLETQTLSLYVLTRVLKYRIGEHLQRMACLEAESAALEDALEQDDAATRGSLFSIVVEATSSSAGTTSTSSSGSTSTTAAPATFASPSTLQVSPSMLQFEADATKALLETVFEGSRRGHSTYRKLLGKIAAQLFYYYAFIEVSINYATMKRNVVNPEHPNCRRLLNFLKQSVSNSAMPTKCLAVVILGNILRAIGERHRVYVDDADVGVVEQWTDGSMNVVSQEWTSRAGGFFLPANSFSSVVEELIQDLLRTAKETDQPIRIYMLHEIGVATKACGWSFFPYLKDTLRLAAAHLLADTFDNAVVGCALGEILLGSLADVLDHAQSSSCSTSTASGGGGSATTTSGGGSCSAAVAPFGNTGNKDLKHRLRIISQDLLSAGHPWLLLCRAGSQAASLRCISLVLQSLLEGDEGRVPAAASLIASTASATHKKEKNAIRKPPRTHTKWPHWNLCLNLFRDGSCVDCVPAGAWGHAATNALTEQQVRSGDLLKMLSPKLREIQDLAIGIAFEARGGLMYEYLAAHPDDETKIVRELVETSTLENFGDRSVNVVQRILLQLLNHSSCCAPAVACSTTGGAASAVAPPEDDLSAGVTRSEARSRWLDRVHQVVLGYHRKRKLLNYAPVVPRTGSKAKADPINSPAIPDNKGEPHSGPKSAEQDPDEEEGGAIVSSAAQKESGSGGSSGSFAPPPFAETILFSVGMKRLFLRVLRRMLNSGSNSCSSLRLDEAGFLDYYQPTTSAKTTPSAAETAEQTESDHPPRTSGIDLRAHARLWIPHVEMLVTLLCKAVSDAESLPSVMQEGLLCLLSLIRLLASTTDADQRQEQRAAAALAEGRGGPGGISEDEDDDGEHEAEPLLLQYEAQIGSCVKRLFKSKSLTPANSYLASLLLVEIVRTGITSSVERVVGTLAGMALAGSGRMKGDAIVAGAGDDYATRSSGAASSDAPTRARADDGADQEVDTSTSSSSRGPAALTSSSTGAGVPALSPDELARIALLAEALACLRRDEFRAVADLGLIMERVQAALKQCFKALNSPNTEQSEGIEARVYPSLLDAISCSLGALQKATAEAQVTADAETLGFVLAIVSAEVARGRRTSAERRIAPCLFRAATALTTIKVSTLQADETALLWDVLCDAYNCGLDEKTRTGEAECQGSMMIDFASSALLSWSGGEGGAGVENAFSSQPSAAQREFLEARFFHTSNTAIVSACSAAAGASRAAGAMIEPNLAVVRHVLVQEAKELLRADGCPTEFQLHSKAALFFEHTLIATLAAHTVSVYLKFLRGLIREVQQASSSSTSCGNNSPSTSASTTYLRDFWALRILHLLLGPDYEDRDAAGNVIVEDDRHIFFLLLLVPLLQNDDVFPPGPVSDSVLALLRDVVGQIFLRPRGATAHKGTSASCFYPALQAMLRIEKLQPVLLPILFQAAAEGVNTDAVQLAWRLLGDDGVDSWCREEHFVALVAGLLQCASIRLLEQQMRTMSAAAVHYLGGCVLAIARGNAALFKQVLTGLPPSQREALQTELRQQMAATAQR